MTRNEKQELNELSKECFGTSSRWQKIVNNGVAEPVEREREAVVPTKYGFEKKKFVDRKNVIRRYTVTEVRDLMLKILEDRKKITVQLNKANDTQT